MIAPDTIVGGRYKVVKPLGGGGMKLVYLAEDLRLASRRCALAEMVDSLTNPEMLRQAEAAFQREADMLAQLSNEHIPRIYDYFSERNHHYLVMEYIDGATLDEELTRAGGRLPEARVIDIAIQVLDTLAYLHGLSPPVIYRDLKPSNVMIAAGGQAKLIDFGIARHFQPLSNVTMIGTQGYAPPEQYRGKVELRSDLYALGATIHHCLTGRDPAREAPFSFPPLRTLAPNVTSALAALTDQALEYDIEKRIPTAQEFRRRLAEIKNGGLNANNAGDGAQTVTPARSKTARPQLKLPLGMPAGGSIAARPNSGAAQKSTAEAATVLIDASETACPGCGRRIPVDSRFCSYCATDLRHVLGAAHVAGDPDAKTADLPDLQTLPHRETVPDTRYRRRLRKPVLILIAIFAFAFFVTRLISYFNAVPAEPPSGSGSVEPIPPPFGAEPGEPENSTNERAAAIRKALDFQGYTNVHFKIEGDTIVLWGSVPTEADRMMVQTIVFTVGNIFSLDDHLKVTDGTW
ncbi:MAG TPA: serine/threonine-protein kinase [Candidatus Binataceae bacterium]|nr:serine/threonine-protein kinase [Candidatus Binataceae bacterium]